MHNDVNGFEIQEWNVHKFEIGGKTTGKVQTTCPFCSPTRKKKNDKCASVNLDTGYFHCFHCGEEGQLHTYKRKNQEKTYVLPPQEAFNFKYSEAVLKWFEARGISENTIKRLKITEGAEWMPPPANEIRRVIKFNYLLQGKIINIKYRDRDKNFKLFKGAEKIMYNVDSIFGKKEAVIVEGEPDVAAYYEAGVYNVTSVPNGFNKDGVINLDYITNCYEYFEDKEKIYLAVDNDEAGKNGLRELVRRFGAEKVWLVDFKDCKDANDYLQKYGKLALQKTLEDAKQYPLENIITIEDEWNDLENFWKNGAPRGMTLGMKAMDAAISFEWKQYTLMLSAPGSGKSEKIDDIVVRLVLKYGIKTAFCSVENEPFFIHYDKLFRKVYGRKPNPDETGHEEVIQIKEMIKEKVTHVKYQSRYELQTVLKKFEELVKRKGIKFFILDPFNKIKLNGVPITDTNNYTSEYHMLLDEFVKKNDCHLMMVVHPTKLPTREGSSKTYIMPTAYHAKGGGEHFDMSYNIMGMVRDYERNLIHFRTLKVKFQHLGTSGIDWFEAWNINNGRFTEIEEDYDLDSTHSPEIHWHNGNWMHSKPWEKLVVKEEDLPEGQPLPTASLEDAFGPPEPINGMSDNDFENDDDVPF